MVEQHTPPDFSAYGIDTLWLNPQPTKRTILIAYAHPDDESFGNAGTIARYTGEGVAVHYACATRGECGDVTPELLEGYADVGALRTQELTNAARALNMAAVHFLGYRDSGMPGAPDNQHPKALVQAPREQVTGQLTALIRALRPQVVITFGPYGGYGHPDHIAMHYATVAAFRAASDASRFPEQRAAGLQPWAPARLYYSTMGSAMLRVGVLVMRLMGRDPRRFGNNQDIDMLRALEEITPTHALINTGQHLEQQDQARLSHRSQLGGMASMMKIPAWWRRMTSREGFTQAIPAWQGGARLRDLFEGIDS